MSILIQKQSDHLVLRLNRPEVRNAFDSNMIREITEALIQHSQDPSIRFLILRGEGKSFSAGADLNAMKSMVGFSHAENVQDAQRLHQLFEVLENFPAPVVGVAHGSAFGGALGLLACCDLVVAEAGTQFCFSEVKLGISPAVISHFILRKFPRSLVAPYMLMALTFDVQAALRMGLVHQIVSQADLEASVEAIATHLKNNGKTAMRETKKLLRDVGSAPYEAGRDLGIGLIASLRVGEEGQEGLRSFLEKRPPAWRGS